MDKFLKKGLIASAFLSLMVPAAMAADIDQPPAPEPAPYVQNDDYVSGWYVRGDAGFSWLDVDGLGDGGAAIAGGGVGYQVNQYFRTDVRADIAFDHDGGPYDLSGTTVLWNGYVDVPLAMGFTPYAGVGVGYGWVDYSGAGSPADDNGFAWAATGGVAFNMTQNIALDVGYRYRNIDVAGPDYADHSVTAGIRWNF
ncbi:MAG: outer membrane beta-barrel protein [Anderseniella sp.]